MDEQAYADEVGPSAGRPLNLRQIEVFRAIMMAGSISGAGRMLHVSQPAVSRVLALTETRLGYRLFERVKSRLSPTAEARRLYAEVEQVYGGIQRVNDLAASLGQSGAGMLKIVASASYGQRLVPMALGRFRDRNADARVDYRSVTFDELAAYFLSGQADIGISMRPPTTTVTCARAAGGLSGLFCGVAQALAAHSAAPAKAIRDEARRIADGRDGMDISGGGVKRGGTARRLAGGVP